MSQPPRIRGLRYFEATGKIGRKLVSGDVHGSSISGRKRLRKTDWIGQKPTDSYDCESVGSSKSPSSVQEEHLRRGVPWIFVSSFTDWFSID
jgi:hypothetical protein